MSSLSGVINLHLLGGDFLVEVVYCKSLWSRNKWISYIKFMNGSIDTRIRINDIIKPKLTRNLDSCTWPIDRVVSFSRAIGQWVVNMSFSAKWGRFLFKKKKKNGFAAKCFVA